MSEGLVTKWNKHLGRQDSKKIKRISYSQFKMWLNCPHSHWLVSIAKKIPYDSNEYTAYGRAVHQTCEKLTLEHELSVSKSSKENIKFFMDAYKKEVSELDEEKIDFKLIARLGKAAKKIIPQVIPALTKKFPDYELVDVEEMLNENVGVYSTDVYNFGFLGYIDLLIKTKDGKYHIIDFKTTNKGWNKWARKDKKNLYQLALYKHYWSSKHDIELDDIETHYAFFHTQNRDIEFFDVDADNAMIEKALKDLKIFIYNAFDKKYFPKNKACRFCDCDDYYKQLEERENE